MFANQTYLFPVDNLSPVYHDDNTEISLKHCYEFKTQFTAYSLINESIVYNMQWEVFLNDVKLAYGSLKCEPFIKRLHSGDLTVYEIIQVMFKIMCHKFPNCSKLPLSSFSAKQKYIAALLDGYIYYVSVKSTESDKTNQEYIY